jgi:hypothetical protein
MRLNRLVRPLAVAVLLALSFASPAQQKDARHRFRWKDAQGNLHIEDSIPPADAKLGYDVVNAQGILVRHVERQKTPEELAQAKVEAEKAEAAKKAATQQSSRDAQMLAAYPNEEELKKAQDAQLALVAQNIETANAGMQSQEKSLSDMLAHAGELERDGKPVPIGVKRQIDTLTAGIAEQKRILAKREEERSAMQRSFEAELKHYRDIKARQDEQRKGG